jgi:hypothetical protein
MDVREMSETKGIFCYELRYGSQVVYIGIAEDLGKAEKGHREAGTNYTSLVQIGLRVSPERAEAWRAQRLADYRRSHRGNAPRHNEAEA